MQLILLLRYWHYIAITLLLVTTAIMAGLWHQRGNDIQVINAKHELQLASLKSDYISRARDIERESYANTIKAVNEAKAREQVIIADAASARDAVASLSNTIDQLSAAAASDANFRVDYARTAGNLLKECSGSYSELAATTDRIANDLRAIQQASRR